MPIRYYSTNRSLPTGFKRTVSFKEALFTGIAPDNGLFMPTTIPVFLKKEIIGMQGLSYAQVAYSVLRKFLHDDISDTLLKKLTKEAYTFDIPLERIDSKTYLARLDQGPTASFKDFACQLLAKLMNALKEKNETITILSATSGDTGSAVGEAFRGIPGFQVVLLYPASEVSLVQKEHMDRIGKNVTAISINAKFDDCQALAKQAFLDKDLKKLNLTSANSINIARLLPQIVYYFYIYSRLEPNQKIVFSVPSGNFGSSFGCELARRMGLPVSRLIIATNANDSFPRFLEMGKYKKIVPSKNCVSNAMNVGNPSNLSRYFDLYGGILDNQGVVLKMPNLQEMRKRLYSIAISDTRTIAAIRAFYSEHTSLLEPHGAVAYAAMCAYRTIDPNTRAVCLETAHPSKFPQIIKRELCISPKMPTALKKTLKREKKVLSMGHDYTKIKKYLLSL